VVGEGSALAGSPWPKAPAPRAPGSFAGAGPGPRAGRTGRAGRGPWSGSCSGSWFGGEGHGPPAPGRGRRPDPAGRALRLADGRPPGPAGGAGNARPGPGGARPGRARHRAVHVLHVPPESALVA
jgi:hypothetical protein